MTKAIYTQEERTRQWDDLLLRLKLAAPKEGQGHALLSVRIFVQDGCPVLWSEPTRIKVEPRKTDLMALLTELCGDDAALPTAGEGS
jgi:hypothetical protein